jgi:long-chain acyl-CoA synthetase
MDSTLPENLGRLFQDAVTLFPGRTAIVQPERSLTFAEFDERCNRVANGLLELGVEPGDRVAVLFSNDFRFLESLFGAMRIRAIAVPMNAKLTDEMKGYVLADSGARALVAGGEFAPRLETILARAPGVRDVIVDGAAPGGYRNYHELFSRASPRLEPLPTAFDEVCMLPYTSGSTGKPKGVLLTHGGQIWNADVMRKASMYDPGDRALLAVPLFHKNAMVTVKAFLLAGGSLAILPGFDPREVILAIEKWRVTYLTGVPAMYKRVLNERELLAKHDVSSVRYAACGSAEVPPELLEEFRRVFRAAISEGYGLTEGGPVPLVNTRWGMKKRGSCGLAFPGCDVKLVAEDGATEVGANEPGELITRNPGLAKGYWKLPEATAEKFRNGWLYTGDLMRRDEDGYYFFLGRKDDVINVAGEKVHPKEIEDLLFRHPNIRDACVVPAPHELKGFVPVAFVCERRPGSTSEEEVKAFCLEHGPAFAHPRRVIFLDILPLGSTGKLDRNGLKQRARDLATLPEARRTNAGQ